MRIEELVIEGFKSYATRTVISGWDSEFNAITGLNGSGKSNILDAICFVLGISNLSAVRAQSLQDLVYKRGQAGISKASVTIVFDNADREKSPIGYENCKEITVTRQVIIGGRNKWLINGHNATQQNVQNLFQSVQLNVNNPHFLIMQGRITKVLNMKPPEILAMIEEAAGTRMYEEKKKKAIETIEKKDKKLDEIIKILDEEITPKLNKLRDEKKKFIEFQKVNTELDHVRQLVIAYDFKRYEDTLSRSDAELLERRNRVSELQNTDQELKRTILELEKRILEIQRRRQKDGGKYHELDTNLKSFQKELVRLSAQVELKEKTVRDEEKQRDDIKLQREDAISSLAQNRVKVQKMENDFGNANSDHEAKVENLRKLEELLQTLSTGLSAKEGHQNGYMDQIAAAKSAATSAVTEVEQQKLRMKHLQKEVKELEPKARKAEKDNKKLVEGLESSRGAVATIAAEIDRMNFDPESEVDLLRRKTTQQDQINELQEKLEQLQAELSRYQFQYKDPSPNFDRSQVKGIVAELVSVPPKHKEASVALEIAAGGRLYNVVVETESVGSQLLKNGQLKRRVTIIPLNKIQSFKISAERLNAAKRIGKDDVNLALNLIGYDDEVQAAMNFVFGSTLICKDGNMAKELAYHPTVRLRTVTYEGDEYDPSGTLRGGSQSNTAGVLHKMQSATELQKQLNKQKQLLAAIDKELEQCKKSGQQFKVLKQQLELKQHEVNLAEGQINSNANAQLIQQLEAAQKEIEEAQQIIERAGRAKAEAEAEVKRLEAEMAEFSGNKEQKLKSIEADVKKAKAAIAKGSIEFKKRHAEIQLSKAELEQSEKDIKVLEQQIVNADIAVIQAKAEFCSLAEEATEMKESVNNAQSALDAEARRLAVFDDETKGHEAERKRSETQQESTQLELQKAQHELQHFMTDQEAAKARVQDMLKEHAWIRDQKQYFGLPDSQYDFEKYNIGESKKKLKHLEEKYETLRKKTDMKVMDTIDRYEKKETSLNQMLNTVKKDKKKIQQTIEELDKHKRQALDKTWKTVNVDFGAIFGDLLPGNTAKLEPPEGQTVNDGLEVKVCLGGVWKQSLTELSGGQRSLIALSLILSLLRYKPAPMYILDEVDAALDLSHTQNIGQMLRTRFTGSQFIVVSLKEGMFNNANVLFRARFRDGVSTVEVRLRPACFTQTLWLMSLSRISGSPSALGGRKTRRMPTLCTM
ncbi:structural maintenance of chromosome 2 [Gonapodya prolifera JEL478]|uniref:Structural maintenance of chromosomes protein n=1 Tax=Gonapodya prolifera (strain JEL478) TaxID=1344416 RepID=A0A139AME8_GONPJ|nr:structural maintenance of chromosome 2 [Gonapodya prolifera JEL478]|eukprot:KXS17946.1 structural maintenance of chromosome 2 [Gonapodya prolifera JEL478]